MNKSRIENITNTDRVIRIIAGLGLIYSVTLQTGALGLTALLPLIAIYPIITGVFGWDPVVKFISYRKLQSAKHYNGDASNAI